MYNLASLPGCPAVPRFKTPDDVLRMNPVDFDRQGVPGSFEHALCDRVDHELDQSEIDARYRNAATRAPANASRAMSATCADFIHVRHPRRPEG